MEDTVKMHFEIDGDNFTSAGEASSDIKRALRQLGLPADVIRRVTIAMYEGEINMVIHADGGEADVEISSDEITIVLKDKGPGIPDVELAMKEGYSTAPDKVRSLGFGAGMGLPNMKKYTDYMNIDTQLGKGTTVTMKIKI